MSWLNIVSAHYENFWGVAVKDTFRAGPMFDGRTDFEILKFQPKPSRNFWTYATCGMSTKEEDTGIELHIFSAIESEEVSEILAATAHYQRNRSRLNLGHTVNFGKPWIEGSHAQYGLISLPYLDGPDLETLELPENVLKFYWMIPITGAEREYKKSNGLESLEETFDRSNFDYANPYRNSLL